MLMHDSELAFGEIHYERRIVAYFDILGWRAHLDEAGLDPKRVARLRAAVAMFSVLAGMASELDPGRISTFSDNVVLSYPWDEKIYSNWSKGLARLQFGSSIQGFYLRGAVTIGYIHQSTLSTFGPALVRAWELEKDFAYHPRIILDPNCPELFENDMDWIKKDEDFWRIDPFNRSFLQSEETSEGNQNEVEAISSYSKELNISIPNENVFSIELFIPIMLQRAIIEHANAGSVKAKSQLAWQINRLSELMNLEHRESETKIS